MSDEPALLAAVLDRPDDDTPRELYADWLDDHGQSERAEFIRVECVLARDFAGAAGGCPTPLRAGRQTPAHGLAVGTVVGPCSACDRCRERAALWSRWRDAQGPKEAGSYPANYWKWFARHLTWAAFFNTARGFVEAVTCPAADWRAHADAILAAHPVRVVTLTTSPVWVPGWPSDPEFWIDSTAHYKEWPGVGFRLPVMAAGRPALV